MVGQLLVHSCDSYIPSLSNVGFNNIAKVRNSPQIRLPTFHWPKKPGVSAHDEKKDDKFYLKNELR